MRTTEVDKRSIECPFWDDEDDEIAEMLGVAKGTVFNYIRRFKIRKIYE